MQAPLKLTLFVAAAGLIGLAAAPPSMAQTAHHMTSHDFYQGREGHYNSLAAFSRSIDGTPCGMNCTREAQERATQPMPTWVPAW